MTSRPAALSARALLLMAMVWLGLMRFSRSAISGIGAASRKCRVQIIDGGFGGEWHIPPQSF